MRIFFHLDLKTTSLQTTQSPGWCGCENGSWMGHCGGRGNTADWSWQFYEVLRLTSIKSDIYITYLHTLHSRLYCTIWLVENGYTIEYFTMEQFHVNTTFKLHFFSFCQYEFLTSPKSYQVPEDRCWETLMARGSAGQQTLFKWLRIEFKNTQFFFQFVFPS